MPVDAKKRQKRMGKISKAFCFESDSMDGAWLAMDKLSRRPGLHYFCPNKVCAYPMKGTRYAERDDYDIVSFVSQNTPPGKAHTHEEDCPFGDKKKKRSTGNGQSTPPRYPPNIAEQFFPVQLVDTDGAWVRTWPDAPPTPEELRGYLSEAETKPARGLIEDVMAADRMMADAYREYAKAKDFHK